MGLGDDLLDVITGTDPRISAEKRRQLANQKRKQAAAASAAPGGGGASGFQGGSNNVTNPAGAGAVNIQDGGNSITVDGTITVGNPNAALQVEDTPNNPETSGNFILGVRNDAAAAATSADGDYSQISVDSAGRVGIADLGGSITVDGPLTDSQLRASAVPVSGTFSDPSVGATGAAIPASASYTGVRDDTSGLLTGVKGSSESMYVNLSRWGGVGVGGAVSSPGDAVTNTVVVPRALVMPQMYNGANWDRMRGDTTNGLDVDVTRVSGTVAVSGPLTDAQLRASAVPVDTELPSAVALSDAQANPTAPAVGAFLMGKNGATWDRVHAHSPTADGVTPADHSGVVANAVLFGYNGATIDRLRSDTTNGLDVDVTRVQGNVATTNAILDALSKAEDAAHSTGDTGIQALTVRKDSPVALAGADGDYQPLITGANGRLFARTVPDRPSQGSGRSYVTANLSNQTADALLYTVTASKVFYVKTLVIFVFNTSTTQNGVLEIKDGTTAAGTLRYPLLMSPAGLGAATAASAVSGVSITFPEPLQFSAGLFCDITLGTLTYSVLVVGYEE